MVNILTGPKGSGKTQQMIDLANEEAKSSNGNIIFIKKSHRDTYSLSFDIRAVCMADYEAITNTDEYIGFIYGLVSSNHDIQSIYIDGILKHVNISASDMPAFIERLKKISLSNDINFYISISCNKEELNDIDLKECKILN